jgi:hypothetical protein
MIKEMLKTAGVENMEDFYKLHPTEEHFFKTYPHMKNKMKKKIRRPKYQPGGTTVPFTDFAAAQTEGDQYAVDQANQQAAQQYLYSHPVYPTVTGRAPGTMSGTLPQVNVTAPQQPFYYTSPKDVYQDFYQNVAPYYPLRSIAEYQQSYAATGMPPQYGNVDEAEKRWRDVQHLKNVSNEEYNAAYDNYRRALEGNHRHGEYPLFDGTSETDADVYGAARTFNPGMQPYVGPTGTKNYGAWYDWNKVKQGLDTGNYNTDTRRYTTMDHHTGRDNDAENRAEIDYQKQMKYRNPRFKETPGVFEQEGYARGGGIRINPAKKGTFTAQATRMGMGVQEAARHILANKSKYSPAMVKKANFARNAAKWKHEDGGYAMPAYGYGSAGVQPQGAQTNSQGYTVQRGVAVPVPSRAYGGYYQEGGETMGQEQMEGAPEQMQEQAMGQEQQQGGQDQMMQQLAQMVAQGLQQGMNPQQIVQMLVQQGIPQQVASQVVQMVAQQMGGGQQGAPGQQYQSQGAQYQGPQAMAAMGGYYANGGINNPGFRALPPSVQQKIMNNMAHGGYADDAFFNQSYLPFDYQ